MSLLLCFLWFSFILFISFFSFPFFASVVLFRLRNPWSTTGSTLKYWKRKKKWLREKKMVISWWLTCIDDYFSSMGYFVNLFGSSFLQFCYFFFDFTSCDIDECYYILLWLVVVIELKVVITRLVCFSGVLCNMVLLCI